MKPRSFLRILALCTIAILVLSNTNTINAVSAIAENPCSGPYVDKVVYREIGVASSRITALENGNIDAIYPLIDPAYVDTLEANPDIGVHSMIENGYGLIDINCGKYPLNITGFRRAFAYAFNKTDVVSDVKNGHAVVHDSVLSIKDNWCIEEDLPWHYYSDQLNLGNQILDSLNFAVDGVYRSAPDGSPFEVVVTYSYWFTYDGGLAEKAVDALRSLGIQASTDPVDLGTLDSIVNQHGDFDMAVRSYSGAGRDLDWILDNYYSENVLISWRNPSMYENDTFDALRDDVLSAATFEETFEAISAIQIHLHENVPVLITHQDIDYQAYRTSNFTGHVEDEYWGIPGPWTNLKVHNKAGNVFGGVYDIAIQNEHYNYNYFTMSSDEGTAILNNLYSGVYKMGPDGDVYLDLAEEVLIETHSTNPAIPEGLTWVTVDVKDDIVWSDGAALNSEDVAFTFTYLYESGILGNPLGNDRWVDDFLSSEVLSPSSAKIVLNGSSYYTSLNAQQMLLSKVIPEHIFNDDTGIGYDGWNTWNPVINPADPHVTCGPFYVSEHTSTTVELSRNLDYHWLSGLAPEILEPSDVTYVLGSTGNLIVWEVTDEDPLDYTIYKDGVLLTTGDWNGSDIIHNIDGLSVGTYNFTVVMTDISGWSVADTVMVTVTPGGVEMPDIMTIGIVAGAAIIIVVIVVVIKKKG